MTTIVLGRDARLPEEPGRLRQAHRHAAGRRAACRPTRPRRPTSSWSTPARSSRRPARSRSTRSSRWPTSEADGARLVVTGCMAERYGDELAEALPEVDAVAGFGVPVHPSRLAGDARWPRRRPAGAGRREPAVPSFDLLNLPRPAATAPWAYVKVAEGCDRACGFCAIPSFRGKQRSRAVETILAEVDELGRAGDRARRPGPRLLRARPGRRRARPSSRWCEAVAERGRPGAPAVPVPVRPHRRADRRHLRHRRAVLRPLAAARVAAAAAPHAALGRRRPVPRAHRRHPRPRARRRVPLQLHRRLPGRDRGRPRPAARASSRRPSSTGAASSPTRREDGTYAAGPRRQVARRADRTSGWPSCASCRTRITAGATRRTDRRARSRCSSTRPASAARTARRPRSTASSPCPTTSRWVVLTLR